MYSICNYPNGEVCPKIFVVKGLLSNLQSIPYVRATFGWVARSCSSEYLNNAKEISQDILLPTRSRPRCKYILYIPLRARVINRKTAATVKNTHPLSLPLFRSTCVQCLRHLRGDNLSYLNSISTQALASSACTQHAQAHEPHHVLMTRHKICDPHQKHERTRKHRRLVCRARTHANTGDGASRTHNTNVSKCLRVNGGERNGG